MKESFFRTAMLLGEDAEAKLGEAKVMVFGVGGVGGHAADALARCVVTMCSHPLLPATTDSLIIVTQVILPCKYF